MARVDETAQIFVGFGVLFVVVPAGDMQRGDARFPPALGEVIEIDTRPVGTIEKSPQALALKWRLHAEIVEGFEQVRESFVSLLAGRRGNPQHCAGAAMQSHYYRRMVPALGGKNARSLGNIEDRNFERRFPNDRQIRRVPIHDAPHHHALYSWRDAERGGQFPLAFQDHDAALFDALDPLWDGSRRDVANNE